MLAGRPGRVLCFYDRHRFTDGVIERMRALHRIEIEAPALYDDGLLRVTRLGPFRMRLAGEVDHSNRPVVARMVAATLDDALRSDSAPAALELDLSSLRFLDVAGAVGLVHAAEEFPEAHRLALTGVRPGRAAGPRPVRGAVRRAARRLPPTRGCRTGFRCPGADRDARGRVPRERPRARSAMRVETTRTAGAVRLRHAVGYTGSAATSSPSPRRSSPPPAAATSRSRWRCAPRPRGRSPTCRPAGGLPGATAGGGSATVSLGLSVGPDHSGQTLATRWARDLRTLTRGRGGVTVIVEHDPDLDGLDGGFWTELDAALNVALADVAATVLCLYPQLPLHLEVADGARRNHPLVLVDGALRHNPEHRGAREVLDRPRRRARTGRARAARTSGWASTRGSSSTCATPSPGRRGRRAATGTGWRTWCWRSTRSPRTPSSTAAGTPTSRCGPATRELLCEVHDDGRLVDPLPGLHAPHPSDPRGRGLWIARQLCDLLHVWADDAGTHVRIRALP